MVSGWVDIVGGAVGAVGTVGGFVGTVAGAVGTVVGSVGTVAGSVAAVLGLVLVLGPVLIDGSVVPSVEDGVLADVPSRSASATKQLATKSTSTNAIKTPFCII